MPWIDLFWWWCAHGLVPGEEGGGVVHVDQAEEGGEQQAHQHQVCTTLFTSNFGLKTTRYNSAGRGQCLRIRIR